MKKIHSIVCCCGQGLGSSMIMEMNVKKALTSLSLTNIYISHVPLAEASMDKGDLYICGLDVAPQLKNYPRVIVLKNIIMYDELEEKLLDAMNRKEDTFYIK